MALSVLSWLVGSKAGRITAIVVLALVAGGLVILQTFARGRAAERAAQQAATLKNLQSRIQTDDQIARMSPDDRKRELARWVSDDGE